MMDERRPRRKSPLETAEAVFKTSPAWPAQPAMANRAITGARELVSLRIDQDVLAHFQNQGTGWQEKPNEALRKASGL